MSDDVKIVLFILVVFVLPIVLWFLNAMSDERTRSGKIIHYIWVHYLFFGIILLSLYAFLPIIFKILSVF